MRLRMYFGRVCRPELGVVTRFLGLGLEFTPCLVEQVSRFETLDLECFILS